MYMYMYLWSQPKIDVWVYVHVYVSLEPAYNRCVNLCTCIWISGASLQQMVESMYIYMYLWSHPTKDGWIYVHVYGSLELAYNRLLNLCSTCNVYRFLEPAYNRWLYLYYVSLEPAHIRISCIYSLHCTSVSLDICISIIRLYIYISLWRQPIHSIFKSLLYGYLEPVHTRFKEPYYMDLFYLCMTALYKDASAWIYILCKSM